MNFGWHNVVAGHGIGLMITGMLIVFCGLLLISGIIVVLGSLNGKSAKPKAAAAAATAADREPTREELIAVAGLVVHLESERSLGEWTQLTIPRQNRVGSIWASAGKMRSLSEGGSHA